MHEYDVRVTRDSHWWKVPEIDQITRARRISEIEETARSLIAITIDTPLADVRVENGDLAATKCVYANAFPIFVRGKYHRSSYALVGINEHDHIGPPPYRRPTDNV